MQIETLKVFCDLVDYANFSVAARRNDITQSAVSQQVRALEKKYNVVFFERGKKNFSLTPEGQVFEGAAREMMEIYNSIDARLKQMGNIIDGGLKVCTIFSIGLHDLPPKAREFESQFDDVKLFIEYKRSEQVYQEVLDGNADIGLVAYPQKRKGIVSEPFDTDIMVLICPPDHRLARRKTVDLKEIRNEKFISFGPDTPTRKAIDKMMRQNNIEVAMNMEFDNIETVKRAVEVSNGVAIVPSRAITAEVNSNRLMSVKLAGGKFMRPLGLLRKRSRPTTPAMREFIKVLKAGTEYENDVVDYESQSD